MATLTAVFCLFIIQAVVLMDNAAAGPNIDINPSEIILGISSTLGINCTFSMKNYPDMAAVVSLNLLRANTSGENFQELAVITQFSPDLVNIVTQEKVTATGVHSQTGESFLHVLWDFPTATQGGVYQCAAHGLDMLAHNVEFTNTSVVTADKANLNDIFEKLKQMETHQKFMKNRISFLESTLSNYTSYMENKVSSLENTISFLESTLANNTSFMENKVSFLENAISTQANHIQSLDNTINQLKAWRQNVMSSQLKLIGTYQDKEYYVSRENYQDIHESASDCSLYGGTLIEINDEEEYNVVVGLLQNMTSDIYIIIGGTDEQTEGTWTLPSTNQPLQYAVWRIWRPNVNDLLNCLLLNGDSSWQMQDYYCHLNSPYLGMHATCEIPSV